jgi:hypothetical protein
MVRVWCDPPKKLIADLDREATSTLAAARGSFESASTTVDALGRLADVLAAQAECDGREVAR